MVRLAAALLQALLLAPSLLAQAEDYQPRLRAAAAVLDRFYGGEPLPAARRRVNQLVDSCNAKVEQRNAAQEAERAQAEPLLAAGRELAATDVAGSAVPASDVGIDGLLGQAFLKRFVYTIDEDRPGKLVLVRRQGLD